ncbi:proliferation-associated protein 2G4 [Salpingoeca rosetta]|uniref:Proliferation-associated protein 2G4 n=1 Tax=Salpingoeca rosetta (strain ATCC 50818 / BSB-021) TaxID=946362 RepID=F2UFN0_SALR5|nr:proliferation-associated protein 2G4 [Salpingoeca rosetta]EGD75598.1 proliferation-associated protein 2G4 [Salpingoeca rosetta]|eukprot:XP_004992055.1 proliferation-associated protein 2G4 [Salpingoeca rosetta]
MDAPGPENPEVLAKYEKAGEIASSVMRSLLAQCSAGAKVLDLCEKGDAMLTKELGSVYTGKVDGKNVPKGISFPTCVSVNNCVCHNSPLKSDKEQVIASGDVVKIDLGVHIDGYIGVCAHTVVVGAANAKPAKGRKADVVLAAYKAAHAAARMVKPGAKSQDITRAIAVVADAFKCKPIADMLSFQTHRFQLNTDKAIIQNPTEGSLKSHKECVFEENEVYAIDVLMSSGEGKARLGDARTTVFKQTDERYHLRGKHARNLFSEVRRKFHRMPFSLRSCESEIRARMGAKECVEHNLLEPYHVLFERAGEYVAQFRMTVLLLPGGNKIVSKVDFDATAFDSEYDMHEDALLKALDPNEPAEPEDSQDKK